VEGPTGRGARWGEKRDRNNLWSYEEGGDRIGTQLAGRGSWATTRRKKEQQAKIKNPKEGTQVEHSQLEMEGSEDGMSKKGQLVTNKRGGRGSVTGLCLSGDGRAGVVCLTD